MFTIMMCVLVLIAAVMFVDTRRQRAKRKARDTASTPVYIESIGGGGSGCTGTTHTESDTSVKCNEDVYEKSLGLVDEHLNSISDEEFLKNYSDTEATERSARYSFLDYTNYKWGTKKLPGFEWTAARDAYTSEQGIGIWDDVIYPTIEVQDTWARRLHKMDSTKDDTGHGSPNGDIRIIGRVGNTAYAWYKQYTLPINVHTTEG